MLTLVLTKTGVEHPSRSDDDSFVVCLNPETSQVRYYQELRGGAEKIRVPVSLLERNPLDMRADLCDPGVMVCSDTLLDVFTENFDYDTVTPTFVEGILSNEKLYQHCIHAYVQEGYAMCARDLKTYMGVTRDILARWVYPIVPEKNFLRHPAAFAFGRNNVYKEPGVKCAPLVALGREVALGAATVVENGAAVTRSSVGRNCSIAAGAQVVGSVLWDNVTIGENAIVRGAVVADGASVLAGARVEEGAMIGTGVVIGKNGVVPAGTFVVSREYAIKHDLTILDLSESDNFGEGFSGVLMEPTTDINTFSDDDDEEDDAGVGEEEGGGGDDGDGSKEEEEEEDEWDNDDDYDNEGDGEEEEEEDNDDNSVIKTIKSTQKSGVSLQQQQQMTGTGTVGAMAGEMNENFAAVQNLLSSFVDGQSSVNDLDVQLKNVRITLNITESACICYFVCSLVQYAVDEGYGELNKFLGRVKRFFDKFAPALRKFDLSLEEQVHIVNGILDFCYGPDSGGSNDDEDDFDEDAEDDDTNFAKKGFPFVLMWLYEYDIITEDTVLAWRDFQNDLGTKRSMEVVDDVNNNNNINNDV